jgi:hypothetical protein
MIVGDARAHMEATGPLSRIVLDLMDRTDALLESAKLRPATADDIVASFQDLVAVDDFVRIGIWREVQTWNEYASYLAAWATAATLKSKVRRITEAGNLVFLELEEQVSKAGVFSEYESMMVYEFDDQRRIRGLCVYVQKA